jgi:hypothetical protein
MFLDEIGLLIKGLKNPNSAAHDVPALLMKLFSGTDRPYIKPYASTEDLTVHWHHLSFYGASTKDRLWENFQSSQTTDGFLARLLLFPSEHEIKMPKPKVGLGTFSPELIAKIDALFDAGRTTGNMGRPDSAVIPKTPSAAEEFDDWAADWFERRREANKTNDELASIYARAAEHAHKLALIHAASMHGPTVPSVGVQSIRWATATVDKCIEAMTSAIQDNIAENEWHALELKVVKLIKAKATTDVPGISARDIFKALKQSKKTGEMVIDSMLANGTVIKQTHKPSRGPEKEIYCLAREKVSQHVH